MKRTLGKRLHFFWFAAALFWATPSFAQDNNDTTSTGSSHLHDCLCERGASRNTTEVYVGPHCQKCPPGELEAEFPFLRVALIVRLSDYNAARVRCRLFQGAGG